jgi:hypothetical protein
MIRNGDCVEVMAGMDADSVDAVVADPPYGLEFMGKTWDQFTPDGKPKIGTRTSSHMADGSYGPWGRRARPVNPNDLSHRNERCLLCGKWRVSSNRCKCEKPEWETRLRDAAPPAMLAYGEWTRQWAREALRVTKPGGYLLAFGGTRTHHRLTAGLEDAGWIIRDTLVWAYASGFPKGRANLKPAWEPIVMARKPGPLRPLNIEECRIPSGENRARNNHARTEGSSYIVQREDAVIDPGGNGRWPANVILTDPIFDGGIEGVVGGGEAKGFTGRGENAEAYKRGGVDRSPGNTVGFTPQGGTQGYEAGGTYSRFFLIAKSSRQDREPTVKGGGAEAGARLNAHPT